MSEEREMKKDKKWAMNQVNNLDGVRIKGNFADFTTIPKDKAIRIISDMDEAEVLSDKWIDDNSVYASFDGVTEEYVHVDELQNLLVPKQEEVDRAYKDGFYKGYREGLANKGGEPETVSDVVANFYEACERLQGVMSMEVEELED